MILPNVIIQPFALARRAHPRPRPHYPAPGSQKRATHPLSIASAPDLIALALAQAWTLLRFGLGFLKLTLDSYNRGASASYRLGLGGPSQEGSLFRHFVANRRLEATRKIR